MFTLGCYLLVRGSRSFLNFETSEAPVWYPEYEVPVGEALLSAAAIDEFDTDADRIYRRDFQNGYVLVNPTSAADGSAVTRDIQLGGTFYLAVGSGGGEVAADGRSNAVLQYVPVTSVRLGPSSAAVLFSRYPGELAAPFRLNVGNAFFESSYVGVAVLNPNDYPNPLVISARNAAGVEIARVQPAEPLGPWQQRPLLTHEWISAPADPTTLVFRGERGHIQGFFMMGQGTARLDGVSGPLQPAQTLLFPLARQSKDEATLLFVYNPNTAAATVHLRRVAANGSLLQTADLTLPASGTLLGDLDQVFGAALPGVDSYLQMTSSAPVIGCEVYSDSLRFLAQGAVTPAQSGRLAAPHIFADSVGGLTKIRLVNTSSSPVTAQLTGTGDNGALLGSAAVQAPAGGIYEGDLTSVLGLDAGAAMVSGRLQVALSESNFAAPESGLAGSVVFSGNHGAFGSVLPLISEGRLHSRFLQVAQDGSLRIVTGMAILNPGSEATSVTVRAFNMAGSNVRTRQINVPPGSRVVDLLDAAVFFGGGFQQVGGHLQVSSSAPVVTFALFEELGMAYLSAIEGQPVE
jgi:hypothetical protein